MNHLIILIASVFLASPVFSNGSDTVLKPRNYSGQTDHGNKRNHQENQFIFSEEAIESIIASLNDEIPVAVIPTEDFMYLYRNYLDGNIEWLLEDQQVFLKFDHQRLSLVFQGEEILLWVKVGT